VAINVGPLNDGRGELVGGIPLDGNGDAHEGTDEEHDGREREVMAVASEEKKGEDANDLGEPREEDGRDGVGLSLSRCRGLGAPDSGCHEKRAPVQEI